MDHGNPNPTQPPTAGHFHTPAASQAVYAQTFASYTAKWPRPPESVAILPRRTAPV